MKRVRYIGPYGKLFGKTALVKSGVVPDSRMLYIQFDDAELGQFWTHNWVRCHESFLEEVEEDTVAPDLMTKRLREW